MRTLIIRVKGFRSSRMIDDLRIDDAENPIEQARALESGDQMELEWGWVRVESVISRNDRHRVSVSGRWRDSGEFCEFTGRKIAEHAERFVYNGPDAHERGP